ncbi:MAG: hypothetical protein M0C28_15810 [Candidatus Moduliflexus flocculans]|nr:hypothetical protein [Candidatus Moduliflexus flocculans]
MPEYTQQAANSGFGRYSEDNYIREIIEQSMGKVSIFGKMPIKVFIDESYVKPYKKFYREAAIEGFKEWEKASENRINF